MSYVKKSAIISMSDTSIERVTPFYWYEFAALHLT